MLKVLAVGLVLAGVCWGSFRGRYQNTGNKDAVITVAAVDTPTAIKAQADYVCDGVADDVEIAAARDALPTVGGRIQLCEGTFYIQSPIQLYRNVQDFSIMLAGAGIGNTLITTYSPANQREIIHTEEKIRVLQRA